jgi:hypothetical protein
VKKTKIFEYTAQVGQWQFAARAASKTEARAKIAEQYRQEFPSRCGFFAPFHECKFTWVGEPVDVEEEDRLRAEEARQDWEAEERQDTPRDLQRMYA